MELEPSNDTDLFLGFLVVCGMLSDWCRVEAEGAW